MRKQYSEKELHEIALKCQTRTEFQDRFSGAYGVALKRGVLDSICSHMPLFNRKIIWTIERLQEEALKYNSRVEFKIGANRPYMAAMDRGLLDDICGHMVEKWHAWKEDEIAERALLYNSRGEFSEHDRRAYDAAQKRGILDEVCKHMTGGQFIWTNEELKMVALKYEYRSDFIKNDLGAYSTASKRGLIDDICSHMKRSGSVSRYEQELMNIIRNIYPTARQLRKFGLDIKNKEYIKGFHIDIYIPELGTGIEFDGTYFHSLEVLKRGHPKWPDEDIRNYHKIKDSYFYSVGIQILHIKEEDWIADKEACIKKCLEFLSKSAVKAILK